MVHLDCVWQGPFNDIGHQSGALSRTCCADGSHRPWLDWTECCPFGFNPIFTAPPPPAPNAGATAQLLDGFPRTHQCAMGVLNDYGEQITRTVPNSNPH